MTREDAIEHLTTISQYYSQDHSDPYEECEVLTKNELDAIDLAIKALEQEPILDKIRAEIIDLANAYDYQQAFNHGLMRAAQIIDKYSIESED